MKKKLPKSYMTDAEREELRASGLDLESIYLSGSEAADHAGDNKATWEWLAKFKVVFLYAKFVFEMRLRII
ncbi:hypothetical protein [Bartonella sp. AP331QHHD]|uniref:hypothetical protein n=1 Tax=Bartonella sp. AP331QHHD TaxID=3243490 RepID=UPI0035CE975A